MNFPLKNMFKVLTPVAAVLSAPAMAVPILEWGYEVESVWTNVVSEDGACTTTGVAPCSNFTITDDTVSWEEDNGNDSSSIELGNNPASGQVLTVGFGGVTVNTAGAVGVSNSVIHNNFVLNGGTNSLDSAELLASVILTPVNPAAGSLPSQMFSFPIEFLETDNAGGGDGLCEDGNAPPADGCEDIFVVDGGLLNQNFDYDGYTYFVNIFPTDPTVFSVLTAGECAAVGAAGSDCLGFITPENQSTEFAFAFTISSEPLETDVPVPGTLALFGLGLLGLARNRRKATA